MELLPKFFSAEVFLDVLSSYVSHPVSSGWIRKYALHSRGEILDMWFWGEKSCESQSCNAESQTSGSGAQTNPVIPSIIVSTGPPLLHATTGFRAAMASKGTMPKCSFTGVYKTQEQREINIAFSSELIDWSMTTSWNTLRSRASLHYTKHQYDTTAHHIGVDDLWRSLKYSTFSFKRLSNPPAKMSLTPSKEYLRKLRLKCANAFSASPRFFFLSNRLIERKKVPLLALGLSYTFECHGN